MTSLRKAGIERVVHRQGESPVDRVAQEVGESGKR